MKNKTTTRALMIALRLALIDIKKGVFALNDSNQNVLKVISILST